MAKKKVRKTKPVAQVTVETVQPLAVPIVPPLYPIIITVVFFVLSLIGILHHEMWRDEYQAWMVAADAHSIPQLFTNLKYEGNPVLWHAFLFVISAFTDNAFGMQLFHILISAGAVFVINRYSPFSIVQKVLLTFSYFVFYEYNIISRSYGLGLLLVVIFLALYQRRQRTLLWMALVLFLLANCTIFGVILAIGLSGYVLVTSWLDTEGKKPKIPIGQLILFEAIALTGALLGYLQIKPEPNNTFPTAYVTFFHDGRLKETIARFVHAYLPVPDVTQEHWWNTNLFIPDATRLIIIVPLLLWLLWIVLLWRNKWITALLVGVSVVLLVFYYYTGLLWSRYTGHLFVILLACYWLLYINLGSNSKPGKTGSIMRWMDKLRGPVWTGFLAIGFIGGIISYILDLRSPFSTSREVSDYFVEQKLDQEMIVGTRDFIASPIAMHLDRMIYYPESDAEGRFIIYDEKRIEINSIRDLIPGFERMYQAGHKRIVLVKDFEIMMVYNDTGETVPWEDAMLTDRLNLRLLKKIEPGIVGDEVYYTYVIEEKLEEQ